MATKKNQWKPWTRVAKKLNKNGYDPFLKWLHKEYPPSVQKVILVALSAADIMMGSLMALPLCCYYGQSCIFCSTQIGRRDCAFPGNTENDVKAAKRLYTKLYKKMPKKWKEIL